MRMTVAARVRRWIPALAPVIASMKRLKPSGLGLFLAAVFVAAGTLVFVTAEPRIMAHPNSPSRAALFPRSMQVEKASKRTVQWYGVALVAFGLGLAAVSLYTPRE